MPYRAFGTNVESLARSTMDGSLCAGIRRTLSMDPSERFTGGVSEVSRINHAFHLKVGCCDSLRWHDPKMIGLSILLPVITTHLLSILLPVTTTSHPFVPAVLDPVLQTRLEIVV